MISLKDGCRHPHYFIWKCFQAGKVFLQSVITYIFVKIKKVIAHNHDSLNQTQSSNGVLAVYWDMVRKCKNLQKYIFTIKIFLLLSVIIKITCWLYKICIYVIKKIYLLVSEDQN